MAGNDGNTKVLLHFNGADASTTITDSNAGGSAHTWTAAGNGQIDTAIAKFGGAAFLCDGTGDYCSMPDHADLALASSDFTIDFWFNVAAGSGTRRFAFGQVNSAGTGNRQWFAEITAANVFQVSVSANGTAITQVTSTTTFTTSGWHHFAFVRTGNVLKLFIDGTQEGGDVAFASALFNSTEALTVGRGGAVTTLTWNGSIDEFRISDVARWTANFTPPTVAYFQEFTLTQTPVKNAAVAGVSTFLRLNRMLAAVKANVAVAGVSVVLRLQRMLAAVKANVQITGIDVDLVSVRITALVGNVVAAGVNVAMRYTRVWRIAASNVQVRGIRVFTDPRASGISSSRAGGGIATRASVTAGPQIKATAGSQRIRAY